MIGQTIGNYQVVSLLGAGGMGEVFLAVQLAIETRVAIKVLQKQISRDQEHVARFFNEARAAGKIKHPGTVKIFDCGFHDGHAYLVMELLEGESLAKRIQRLVRLPGPMAAEIARQIAAVLEAVHAAGVTHRDLKPDNVYMVPDPEFPAGERVKILDFGIAKLTGSLGGHSPQTKGAMGTPAYMAPEQWDDSSNVDGSADVYSLGCVAFEMLAGSPPFPAGSIAQACHHHLHSPPPSVAPLTGGPVPPQLEALLFAMLAKLPGQRPSIRDAGRAFGEIAAMDWTAPASASFTSTAPGYSLESFRPPTSPHGVGRPPTGVGRPPTGPHGVERPPHGVTTVRPPSTPPYEPPPPPAPAPKRTGLLVGLGVLVAAGGAVGIYAATRGGGDPAPPGIADGAVARGADAAVPPSGDAAEALADAAEAPASDGAAPSPTPAQQLAATNPYVDVHGVLLTRHQVTAREYRTLVGGGAPDDDRPLAWVTHAQAAALCELAGGALPSSSAWERAAAGTWGITIDGITGPLQEWTSTIRDELAVVRGGYDGMSADLHARAKKQRPPYSVQKDPATGQRNPQLHEDPKLGAAHLGFRCTPR